MNDSVYKCLFFRGVSIGNLIDFSACLLPKPAWRLFGSSKPSFGSNICGENFQNKATYKIIIF